MTALLFSATTAWPDPREDANAANARGDYATEMRILRPLATKGEAWAQSNLGVMYEQGHGVPQNYEEAVKWYRLAAGQGHGWAQFNLGVMYDNGQGVPQDYAEAARWYRLAAAQRISQAQLNLAVMYAKGEGMAQNYVRALMWAELALTQGAVSDYQSAVIFAQRMEVSDEISKKRDIIAKHMTKRQITEAQKMARDCQARNFKGCE